MYKLERLAKMLKTHRKNTETKDDFIMNKRFCTIFIALLISSLVVSVYAQVSVGLKEGDWVEYTATYTGNPPDTYPEAVRIEVKIPAPTKTTIKVVMI